MTDEGSEVDILEDEYDSVPYQSFPFRQSHPVHLYTIAKFFGLKPKAVEKSRVLELGCASGGNIIPMAYYFPSSEFLGIDLSKKQIDEGIEHVTHLNIKNITLRHQSILNFKNNDGKFDYIICHGVYSWVNDEVRDKILNICQKNLTKNGIAYISYNTLPGWNMVSSVRDLMMWHTRNIAEPDKKAQQARAVLKFISDGLEETNTPYAKFLSNEIQILSKQSDNYLLHEHLSTYNKPVYFYQFMESARAHKLAYLSDVSLPLMFTGNLPLQFSKELERVPNLIVSGQYVDFIRNQRFRSSLLCHEKTKINRALNTNGLEEFYIRLISMPVKEDLNENDVKEGSELVFKNSILTLTVRNDVSQYAMIFLHKNRHRFMHYNELVEATGKKFQSLSLEDIKLKINNDLNLMRGVLSGVFSISSYPDEFETSLTEKPIACPLARFQAKRQNVVTNRHHQTVRLDPISKILLPNIDGSKTIPELIDLVFKEVNQGNLSLHDQNKNKITDPKIIDEKTKEICQDRLKFLLINAIFVPAHH